MHHTVRISRLKFLQVIARSLWTYVVLGLLVFYALLYLVLELPANLEDFASVNPLRTLLGGLATGLITAQALVFTISLVAAQLNARYTHRMVSRIFTWPTGIFMGLFIGSSIYSMVVLAALSSQSPSFIIALPGGLPALHPVTLALALAGTCLVLLVPYLWSFKQRLDPERMAVDEGRRTIAYLHKNQDGEPPGIAALDNIIMSAYGYRDYDTFARSMDQLSKVGLEARNLRFLCRFAPSKRHGFWGVQLQYLPLSALDGEGTWLPLPLGEGWGEGNP